MEISSNLLMPISLKTILYYAYTRMRVLVTVALLSSKRIINLSRGIIMIALLTRQN